MCKQAFNQILILLRGGKISTPMRHVTNALMAVCLALLLNFLRVLFNRRRKVSLKEIDKKQVVEGIGIRERADFIKKVNSKMISQKKKRHSDSSSGSGSSGSGGGGGGGGSSGGHSF